MRRVILLALPFMAVLCSAQGGTAEALHPTSKPVRVAIIGDYGEQETEASIADMLVAELSAHAGIALVEREQIQKALDEQSLTVAGFVAADAAVATGQLLAVDLFATVETLRLKSHQSLLRLRVIDAQTGRVLDSAFAEEVSRETPPIAFRDTIVAAVAKTRVPMQQRRYVCLLGVRSEEAGRFLDGLAHGLQFLLGHDLNRATKVHLLDRERLRRLTEEKALSGIDLDLKTSALFVDCGVQRAGVRDGLIFHVELRPVSGGRSRTFEVVTASRDMTTVRKVLAARILTELNAKNGSHAAGDAVKEAALLLERVKHLVAHEAGIEAVPLAEAAHALAPSQATRLWLAKASKDYAYTLRSKSPSTEDKVRIMKAQIREREIELEMFKEYARLQQMGKVDIRLPLVPGTGGTRVKAGEDEKLVRALMREEAMLRRNIAYFRMNYFARVYADQPSRWQPADAILAALHEASSWADSAEGWESECQQLIERYVAIYGPGEELPIRGLAFHGRLMTAPKRFARPVDHAVVERFWDWMKAHRDPIVALLGYDSQIWNDKTCAEVIAREAVDYFHAHLTLGGPARQQLPEEKVARQMIAILSHGMPDERERIREFLKMLDPVVDAGDRQRLYWWLSCERRWDRMVPLVMTEEEQHAWAERVLAAYGKDPPRCGHSVTDGLICTPERQLRRLLKRLEGTKGQSDLWSRLQVEELRCEPPTPHAWIQRADWTGDGWLVVWRDGYHRVVSYGPEGGEGEVLGRFRLPRCRSGPSIRDVVQADGRTYLASHVGLIVCDAGQVTVMCESDGLPATNIVALAALQEHIYFSVVEKAPMKAGYGVGTGVIGAALCRLDTSTRSVVTIASSRSMSRRNPLDGEFLFTIKSLLADPDRSCLWMAVTLPTDAASKRNGIWKYTPEDGRIVNVLSKKGLRATDLRMHKGALICRYYVGNGPLYRFNPRQGSVEGLTGWRDAHYGAGPLPLGSFAFLGEDLVAASSKVRLVSPGSPPLLMQHMPDGTPFPEVSKVRQVGHSTILLQPAPRRGISQRLWVVKVRESHEEEDR